MGPVRITNPNSVYNVVPSVYGDNGDVLLEESGIKNHQDFLPTWNKEEKYKPLEFFEHIDPGLKADKRLLNLLPEHAKTKSITPKFGSEVFNVQISDLSEEGKNELALFVAQRGVVVFRNQDFASKGAEFVTEYARHFGRLHIHPTSGSPKGYPELHVVYRRPQATDIYAKRNNLVAFHSDVSYELQPPGTTFLSVLEGPESGGDTLFADTNEAYNRLSPALQERLEGLHVLHSSLDQANFARRQGGNVKRHPVENIHPLVRIHPVTGVKTLYVNRGFSRSIIELKEEESDALLKFLYDHIDKSHDLQARAVWEPNSVVVWDNRRTAHSAILDWEGSDPRLAFRVTPQAERPVDNLENLNKPDNNLVYQGLDFLKE